jgi:hypothetical protein
MSLPQLPQDKANHALYGAAFAIFAVWALGWRVNPMAVAVLSAALIGAVKEFSDWYINRRTPDAHDVSPLDILATTLGGVLVSLAIGAAK